MRDYRLYVVFMQPNLHLLQLPGTSAEQGTKKTILVIIISPKIFKWEPLWPGYMKQQLVLLLDVS